MNRGLSLTGRRPALLATVAIGAACGSHTYESWAPRMAVLSSPTSIPAIDELAWGATKCEAVPLEAGALFVFHELPPCVTPPSKLTIELRTPCATKRREVEHVDLDGTLNESCTAPQKNDGGLRALVPFAIPFGAACGVSVTATISNSKLGCAVDPVKDLCDQLDLVRCAEESEASEDESSSGGSSSSSASSGSGTSMSGGDEGT